MRPFNKKEKEIISELVHLKDRYHSSMKKFVTEYVFPLSTGSAVYFDILNQNAYLVFPIDPNKYDCSERFDNFYELLSLLMYLEANRYITIFTSPAPAYWHNLVILGETFDEVGGKSEYGYIISHPLEAPEISWEPVAYKDKITTHTSFELGYSIYKQAYHLLLNEVYVSEDLKQLVKRKFRMEEEVRSFNQLLVAWIGIFVALVLGVCGLFR